MTAGEYVSVGSQCDAEKSDLERERRELAGDRLAAHARDELGIGENSMSNPLQAAWASAVAFSAGAALPVIAVATAPGASRIPATVAVTLVALPWETSARAWEGHPVDAPR